MVDPWKHWPTLEYLDWTNRGQAQQDIYYKYVQAMTMAMGDSAAARAAILRLTSEEAADLIPDSSLVSAFNSLHAVSRISSIL